MNYKHISLASLFSILILAGAACTTNTNTDVRVETPKEDEVVFCTMDAKECPDGSYVSRVAPSCEFAPCPGETATSSASNNNNEKPTTDKKYAPQRITVEGQYVCLPHKDTTGPQTEECALGIRTTEGTYYALDTGVLQTGVLMDLATGTRIKVEGPMTPIEMLSSNHWQKYNVKGIITVTSAAELE